MATDVDIVNLALSNLGDTATVASINPPEKSAQAQHAARFYPIARNSLLEMATWGFATRRTVLASVDATAYQSQWQYAYAMPAKVINVIAVLSPEATDDYSEVFAPTDFQQYPSGYYDDGNLNALYTPQPYTIETDSNGNQVILTNVENAVLRHTVLVEDATQFSPLFVTALSWLLASMLAGSLIKGDAGAAAAQQCLAQFRIFEAQAEASDANQRRVTPRQVVPWISGR